MTFVCENIDKSVHGVGLAKFSVCVCLIAWKKTWMLVWEKMTFYFDFFVGSLPWMLAWEKVIFYFDFFVGSLPWMLAWNLPRLLSQ